VLRRDRLHVTPLPPDKFKYEGLVDDTALNDAYLVFNPRCVFLLYIYISSVELSEYDFNNVCLLCEYISNK